MKKFVVFSILAALAGITVGVIRRQAEPTTIAVEAVAAAPTTSTTVAETQAAPTSSTTSQKATAKVASKATTTTRPSVAGSSPTTVTTTAAPVTTTTTAPTTTTTTATGPAPTCTATVDKPSVSEAETQTIRVSSTMPLTKTRIEIQYPKFDLKVGVGNPRQTYTPATDAMGSATQTFRPSDWSTSPAAVKVQFYGPTGNILGSPSCGTTFISSAR